MIIGVFLSFLISILNTRFLGPEGYGNLKFLQFLFGLTSTLFPFGIIVTVARIVAIEKYSETKNEIMGSSLVLIISLSLLMAFSVFVFSFFEEKIFGNELGKIVAIFSPLAGIYIFKNYLENLFQGDNRIFSLGSFRTLQSCLYIPIVLSLYCFKILSFKTAFLSQLLIILCLSIYFIAKFKPEFNNLKNNIKFIFLENKHYGVHVYIGTLSNVATSQIGPLIVGLYLNNKALGLFALALTLSSPIAMVPSSIATTFFKDFANVKKIPKRLINVNLGLSVLSLSAYFFLIDYVVEIAYPAPYRPVASLAKIAAVGSLLHGVGDLFNRFLGAHGQGRLVRNGVFLEGGGNVLGYVFLVKFFGVEGAAFTKMLSGILYFIAMFFQYKVFERSLRGNPCSLEKYENFK